MRILDPLVEELEREAAITRRLLDLLPEGRLSWKPHPKSYSLGELAWHVAVIPGLIAGIVARDTLEMPDIRPESSATKAEILAAFDRSLSDARQLFTSMDDARAGGNLSVTRDGKQIHAVPRLRILRVNLISHCCHHRGQLAVYLSLLDVSVPSIYCPFVPFVPLW